MKAPSPFGMSGTVAQGDEGNYKSHIKNDLESWMRPKFSSLVIENAFFRVMFLFHI